MCGLTGFWARSAHAADLGATAAAMADRIRHGPDDEGVCGRRRCRHALAHRRCPILDLSPPSSTHGIGSGRWVLIYNGEVYNHLELRRRLETEGAAPAWRGHSDTETLLAAIEAWSRHDPQAHIGMFAIALWDRTEQALWLARTQWARSPSTTGGRAIRSCSARNSRRCGRIRRSCGHRSQCLDLVIAAQLHSRPAFDPCGHPQVAPATWLRWAPGSAMLKPVGLLVPVRGRGARHGDPFGGSETEATDLLEQHLGNAVRGQRSPMFPLFAAVRRHRFGDDHRADAGQQRRAGSHVHHRIRRTGIRRGGHARAVAAHLGTITPNCGWAPTMRCP